MEPMFFPEVEKGPGSGAHARVIEMIKSQNASVPQILHIFAYKPEVTDHVARWIHSVLRGSSPLSPGQRELIGAFTSNLNHCPY